jgi:hypothetical protein
MRARHLLIAALLAATTFSGCLGGDDASGRPRAAVNVEPVAGRADTYRFDASQSTGRGLGYAWSFSDGGTSTDAVTVYTFEYGDDTYTVDLLITDAHGRQDYWRDEVVVGSGVNHPPIATFRLEKRIYAIGESIRVDASGTTDPESDPLDAMANGKNAVITDRLDPFGLLGPKHGEGEGLDYTPSHLTHTATTRDPVYVFSGGIPDETIAFIRLRAFDVKGAHAELLSEDIWPVKVESVPPDPIQNGTFSGFFDFGVGEGLAPAFSAGEGVLWTTQATKALETHWPIATAKNVGENVVGLSTINVTWAATGPSDVDLNVTLPDGTTRTARDLDENRKTVELDGRDGIPDGDWTVRVAARQGADIEWTVTYRFRLELNPFLSYET